MKLKDLLEQQQPTVILQTDDIMEYQRMIDKLSSQNDMYHYEEVSPKASEELFDIVVQVNGYSHHPETRHDPEDHDIDWNVEYYGTGDYDTETQFYIKQTATHNDFPLSDDIDEYIEQDLLEKQEGKWDQTEDEYNADNYEPEYD